MRIHSRIGNSNANGPGDRAVVWFQGCQGMNCPGCWNPDTHAFDSSGQDETAGSLVAWILAQPEIEGVTFSGGEPFQHAPFLELVIHELKQRRPDFSIGAFTGYTQKELEAGKFEWWSSNIRAMVPGDSKLAKAILSQMDFIIAGRYNEQQLCNDKQLCGSRNQQVIFLSDRYTQADLPADNIVEFTIDPVNNLVSITGLPPEEGMDLVGAL